MRFAIAIDIQNDSSGKSILLGRIADDETVADENDERRIQSQLRDGFFAGTERFVLKQN